MSHPPPAPHDQRISSSSIASIYKSLEQVDAFCKKDVDIEQGKAMQQPKRFDIDDDQPLSPCDSISINSMEPHDTNEVLSGCNSTVVDIVDLTTAPPSPAESVLSPGDAALQPYYPPPPPLQLHHAIEQFQFPAGALELQPFVQPAASASADVQDCYVKFTTYPLHFTPEEHVAYFQAPHRSQRPGGVRRNSQPGQYLKTLGVFIPAFNEEASELINTLDSCHRQRQDCLDLGYDMHVLIVLDGWEFTSKSVKEYLGEIFSRQKPSSDSDRPAVEVYDMEHGEARYIHDTEQAPWQSLIQPLDTTQPQADQVETYTLQMLDSQTNQVADVNLNTVSRTGDMTSLKISVLIKRDNRRKHNSHHWFLKAFCDVYEPEYLFMTDAGSIVADQCLQRLITYMNNDPTCSASTARMRILPLSVDQSHTYSLRQKFYHAVQTYEYEFTQNVITPCFSFLGHLLVIPGAGGLFRYAAIREECIDYYVKTTAADIYSEQASDIKHNPLAAFSPLLTGSLLLAEDRVLTYGCILKGRPAGMTTRYVPNATFFVEAETDYEKLLTQRRRWQNGTISGIVYVLSNYGELFTLENGNVLQKIAILLLTACQLVLYFSSWMSPAYFVLALNAAIAELVEFSAPSSVSNVDYYQNISMYTFICIFGLFILLHVFMLERKVVRWIFDVATLLCVLVVAVIIFGLIVQPISSGMSLLWCLFVGSLLFPYVLTALQSIDSLIIMLKTSPAFLLWTPTYIVFITYYGLCRLWELTWGNRPSSIIQTATNNIGGSSAGNAEKVAALRRDKLKLDLIDDSRLICIMLLLVNVCVVMVVRLFSSNIMVTYALLAVALGGLWVHFGLAIFYVIGLWYNKLFVSRDGQIKPENPTTLPAPAQQRSSRY